MFQTTNQISKDFYLSIFCSKSQVRGFNYLVIKVLEMENTMMYTLWLFNIAIENDTFIDDFPMNTSIYSGFSMAMLNNQMVC